MENDKADLVNASEPQLEEVRTEQKPKRRKNDSPPWGWATKLIVGLLLVVGLLALVIRFKQYFILLLTAFLIAFLLHPICDFLHKKVRINWRLSVVIVYLFFASLIIWGIVAGGAQLANQVQSLVQTIINNVDNITAFLEKWSQQKIVLGPFQFTTPNLDFESLGELISDSLQPIVSQAGNVATTVVGKVGGFLFNIGITFMVSFFLISESEGAKRKIFNFSIPGYEKDFRRLGQEISKIFNAFIRGEFTVVTIAIAIYSVYLGIMGLPYFFILAIIAGLGRFIPYLGAAIGWIGFFVGAMLQDPTPFGLTNFVYAILIVGVALAIDVMLDHMLMPKVMGQSLEVHPAGIMISALVGAQILGILGVILAAPAFATVKLLLRYSTRKLFDQDPWAEIQYYQKPEEPALVKGLRKLWSKIATWLEKPLNSIRAWFKKTFKRFYPPDEHQND